MYRICFAFPSFRNERTNTHRDAAVDLDESCADLLSWCYISRVIRVVYGDVVMLFPSA